MENSFLLTDSIQGGISTVKRKVSILREVITIYVSYVFPALILTYLHIFSCKTDFLSFFFVIWKRCRITQLMFVFMLIEQ
jgi:hypothetical protein